MAGGTIARWRSCWFVAAIDRLVWTCRGEAIVNAIDANLPR